MHRFPGDYLIRERRHRHGWYVELMGVSYEQLSCRSLTWNTFAAKTDKARGSKPLDYLFEYKKVPLLFAAGLFVCIDDFFIRKLYVLTLNSLVIKYICMKDDFN